MTTEKPEYLYYSKLCPCPRGRRLAAPDTKKCNACIAFHREAGNPAQTACEKKARILVSP